jgi:hypothetical protein
LGDGITAVSGSTYTPDPKRHLVFPFNYGNSYTDSYQCISCSPGSFTVTYDAYGTLIANGKTYNNVVRLTNMFGFPYYSYYSSNPVYPIMSYDSSPSSGPYATLIEVSGGGVGIDENFVVNHMNLYPNPAQDKLNIRNDNFMKVDVEIYDMLGKLVKNKEQLLQGATTTVDISAYTSGLYVVKYHDEFGNDSYTKLVVE